MNNEHGNKLEQRVRFVAKRYREGSLDPDKAWQKFASEHAISRKVSFRRYWIGAAAVVLVLVGLGTWFTVERNAPDWVAITTAPGQMKDVYLPDSTLVALAGDSWIRYDAKRYDKERRAVEMNGKAFFQVTRNEARPFSVETSQTEVNVVTGKVCFTAGEEKENVILTAGMSAQYSMENKEITVVTEEDVNKLAWRTGQLRFMETPLDKVIEDLSDYYQVKIANRTKNEGARLTATFNNLPLEDVLQVVNQTLDARLVSTSKK